MCFSLQTELNCLSRIGGQLGHCDIKFERLEVDASVAAKIFEDNRFICFFCCLACHPCISMEIFSVMPSMHLHGDIQCYKQGGLWG